MGKEKASDSASSLSVPDVETKTSQIQPTLSNFFGKSASKPDTVSDDMSQDDKKNGWLNVQTQTTKAEILECLKYAKSNLPFSSCDGSPKLYSEMFPDSMVAKQYKMSRQKMSYVISYGLGPYFQQQTVEDLMSSDAFYTIHFDETVTGQAKKQMDILIRYWSCTSASVNVRFIHAVFFGHAFADRVVNELVACLNNLGLPLKKLLSISADGPNVNKSIKSKLDECVKEEGSKGLVDVGFCYIHSVNTVFKRGNEKFGNTALDFAMDVYSYFHMYPARDEDLQFCQEEEDIDQLSFLRHVESRWLTLLPAVLRVHSQMDALKRYFLDFIPKNDKTTAKK